MNDEETLAQAIYQGFEKLAGSFGAGETSVGAESVSVALAMVAKAIETSGDRIAGAIEQLAAEVEKGGWNRP